MSTAPSARDNDLPICASSAAAAMPLRFVRLNPRFDRNETLSILKTEIRASLDEQDFPITVPWLASKKHQLEFFAIPGEFSLNRSSSFRSGRVYGMDVTSGAAVAALLFDLYDLENTQDEINVTDAKRENAQHLQKKDPIQSAKGNSRALHVLDLCCAPGLKLCTIADLVPPSSVVVGVDVSQHRISLCKNIIKKYHIDETASTSKPANTQQEILLSPCKNNDSTNTLTSSPTKHDSNLLPGQGGSDIENHSRVTIRLYCADGTTFGVNSLNSNESQSNSEHGLVFDSSIATEELKNRGRRKRLNKSARAREKRRLLELHRQELEGVGVIDDATSEWGKGRENSTSVAETKYVTTEKTEHLNGNHTVVPLFDRVLVDAECSTDGAVRHIQKRSSSSTSPRGPAWDDTNMNELVNLQKRLIESGFNLLRSGGVMVYSTCSLSGAQNEEVVLWLLTKYKDAFVVPVSFKCNTLSRSLDFMAEGSIRGTVRFKPNTNEVREKSELDKCLPEDRIFSGGGFFLAKIGKSLD